MQYDTNRIPGSATWKAILQVASLYGTTDLILLQAPSTAAGNIALMYTVIAKGGGK